jgi:hypothetical protein
MRNFPFLKTKSKGEKKEKKSDGSRKAAAPAARSARSKKDERVSSEVSEDRMVSVRASLLQGCSSVQLLVDAALIFSVARLYSSVRILCFVVIDTF